MVLGPPKKAVGGLWSALEGQLAAAEDLLGAEPDVFADPPLPRLRDYVNPREFNGLEDTHGDARGLPEVEHAGDTLSGPRADKLQNGKRRVLTKFSDSVRDVRNADKIPFGYDLTGEGSVQNDCTR
jgi:hypothetical protein